MFLDRANSYLDDLDEDDKRFYNKTERKSNSFRRGKL
jgi:hypothetical protein